MHRLLVGVHGMIWAVLIETSKVTSTETFWSEIFDPSLIMILVTLEKIIVAN